MAVTWCIREASSGVKMTKRKAPKVTNEFRFKFALMPRLRGRAAVKQGGPASGRRHRPPLPRHRGQRDAFKGEEEEDAPSFH